MRTERMALKSLKNLGERLQVVDELHAEARLAARAVLLLRPSNGRNLTLQLLLFLLFRAVTPDRGTRDGTRGAGIQRRRI